MRKGLLLLLVAFGLPVVVLAVEPPKATPAPDLAVYQPRYRDPVLTEMEAANKAAAKSRDDATQAIRDTQQARRDAEKKTEQVLRFDMSKIVKPASPTAFKQPFFFPPQAQYLTGTCWSFSTTSYYESEVYRLTGQKIKLSEIWTVYFEYVEKMRRFVRERGDSLLAEGSESNAFQHIWPKYGIVPAEAYPGVLDAKGRHDHAALIEELVALGEWVKQHDLWDEELVTRLARAVLDKHLGAPPEVVRWQGVTYTPKEFLTGVLKLSLDDYVEMMSTLSVPFYATGEYKVPDNWWHDASYHNVPLEVWYGTLRKVVEGGLTVAIGGDVSEPGLNGFENAAVIPSFDIPQGYIDQNARELRFYNHTTEDDHGLHLVSVTQAGGHDWFLIKDSGRSSRHGKFEGFYFYRDDFVRLKMLTYTVHREAVKDILAKFKQ
jgi:bleomycin hydrolase